MATGALLVVETYHPSVALINARMGIWGPSLSDWDLKAPNIALPPNGKIPQAPKPRCKTWQHRSKNADKDIKLEPPIPTPAAPCPVLCKKSGTVSGAAPGTNAEDEVFIPPHTLQKRIPNHVAEGSDPPPPAQPHPPPFSPFRSTSPDSNDSNNSNKTPPPSQPHCNKTPAFEKDFLEKTAKGKKGRGKKCNVEGPFKSGTIPKQAKQSAFAIHANFEKQIQDLATEISKVPQLLFLFLGEAWYGVHREMKKSKHIAAEHDKYCKAKLGNKWEDPKALATLF
ncbi:hypothetical protein DXG01_003764 [Tephrocybe rancida]|nr:hypothetical protein DXG01_003764 [Tephrocybe rancida]